MEQWSDPETVSIIALLLLMIFLIGQYIFTSMQRRRDVDYEDGSELCELVHYNKTYIGKHNFLLFKRI